MSERARNRRDRAAAVQAAAESTRRRERAVLFTGIGVVALVSVGLIAFAWLLASKGNEQAPLVTATPNPAALAPQGTIPAGELLEYGVVQGSAATPTTPTLELWEDFQCPACGNLEALNGTGIEKLVDEGLIKLVWRPTTFIDDKINNDASLRAAAAWGCAIDAGKTREYHAAIFANQPATEGDGYSNELLLSLGEQVGITGADLDAFKACVTEGTYLSWVANSRAAFDKEGIQSTPTGKLNGVLVDNNVLADDAALREIIAQTAK